MSESVSYIRKALQEYLVPVQSGNCTYIFILAFNELIPDEDLKEAEYLEMLGTLCDEDARTTHDMVVLVKSCAKARITPFAPKRCESREQRAAFFVTPTTENLRALLTEFYREYELMEKRIIDAKSAQHRTLPMITEFVRSWIPRINQTLDMPA